MEERPGEKRHPRRSREEIHLSLCYNLKQNESFYSLLGFLRLTFTMCFNDVCFTVSLSRFISPSFVFSACRRRRRPAALNTSLIF